MISFQRLIQDGRFVWKDTSDNQLYFNLDVFNDLQIEGEYEGQKVIYRITSTYDDAPEKGISIEMYLKEPTPFHADCHRFELKDAEFVRAIKAAAINVVAPSTVVFVD